MTRSAGANNVIAMDPDKLTAAIDDVLVMMKTYFHEEIRKEDAVRPQFAVICTVDPATGKPVVPRDDGPRMGLALVIVVPSRWETDDDRDNTMMMLRAIAVAGHGVASVACLDGFALLDDDTAEYEKRDIMPSDSAKRREVMWTTIERKDSAPLGSVVPYRREGDEIIFDDSRIYPGHHLQGRMVGIIPKGQPSPAEVAMVRMLIGAMSGVTFTEI